MPLPNFFQTVNKDKVQLILVCIAGWADKVGEIYQHFHDKDELADLLRDFSSLEQGGSLFFFAVLHVMRVEEVVIVLLV
ncbi:hypothetical protein DGG96_18105 [Legionella qingyii]|uniref:Uncharacterized protein n=1 Tax=Legionella qingyii TaxID=2184757 RepID=A0A317TYU4_9GAMM|nr:hypothetical protein DGG96_18105 [Legionella qingyii]